MGNQGATVDISLSTIPSPAMATGAEVAFQVHADLAVQRGVDKRVVTGRAHGHDVAADL